MSTWPLLRNAGPLAAPTFTDNNSVSQSLPFTAAAHTRVWSTLVSPTPFACAGIHGVLLLSNEPVTRRYLFSLGIGGAGAEVPLIEHVPGNMNFGYRSHNVAFTLMLGIPAGVRLAFGYQWSDGTAGDTPILAAQLIPAGPGMPTSYVGADVFGANPATTDGSLIVSSQFGGGPEIELVASTAREYRGFTISPMEDSTNALYTLAIGPAGASGPVSPYSPNVAAFGSGTLPSRPGAVVPCLIPAGVRVGIRAQYGASPSNTRPIVHLYY